MAKPPTMDDVAREAAVSRALVSLVMNASPKVSDQKRQAVLRAASDLGYQPNLHARSLAQKRTRTIGVLINDLHNPFFSEVIDGIEHEADEQDLRVLILNGGSNPAREQRAIETYVQFRVEAIVLVGSRLADEVLLGTARQVPSVVVAAGRDHAGVDTITTDDDRGAELAVGHLIELGHRDIVHIDGERNISADPRRNGYIAAMRAAGLSPRVLEGGDDEDGARGAVEQIATADQPVSAIFAFNDLLAAGVLDRLDDAGIEVPADMSLVGYDNTFIASLHHLSLTTVNQPRREMGRLAVTTMLERIEDGREEPVRHQLEPSLVVRGTTAPPGASDGR